MEKNTSVEGQVVRVIKENANFQELEIRLPDKVVKVKNGQNQQVNYQRYYPKDRVILKQTKTPQGTEYFVSQYVRTNSLLILLAIFIGAVILIAKKRGVSSLIGMLASFVVIFGYILPNLASGQNPINVAISGSLVIIPITFFLSHGFNRKTVVAIVATSFSLIITGLLALLFVNLTRLSGFSSDEAAFLQIGNQGNIQMEGLLLAGIIIGVLGVLDDVTVSQAAIVFQLKKTDPSLGFGELVKKTMEVGHDHISSMVNTLILVYTGASLPLLLLFIKSPQPFSQVVNYELIAEEIVRTLVSSIGLVISVPITTFLATYVACSNYFSEK